MESFLTPVPSLDTITVEPEISSEVQGLIPGRVAFPFPGLEFHLLEIAGLARRTESPLYFSFLCIF